MEFHPLANIFPLIEGAEFEALVADVKENGVHEPVILLEGMILDGRNRYRAAAVNSVAFETIEYRGNDPLGYVVSLNLRRRHLDESQRAMVMARIATLPKGVRSDTAIAASVLTQEQASRLLNVSVDSGQRARKVIDEGAPELVAAVERGEVSVSAAAEVASLTKEEQIVIVARGEDEIVREANRIKRERKEEKKAKREAIKRAVPDNLPRVSDRFTLMHADLRDADIKPESIDLILTDPPYPEEHLECFRWLADCAAKWLKPGGTLAVMSGQAHLPKVIDRLCLNDALSYRWTMAYLTPGGQAVQIFPRKVNTFWKPIILMQKGNIDGDWIGDVSKSDPNDNDKRFHHWGQSESGIADLINRLSLPGQVICDPFLGGGTTGLVSVQMNRVFIGCDIDENNVKISASRMQELANAA